MTGARQRRSTQKAPNRPFQRVISHAGCSTHSSLPPNRLNHASIASRSLAIGFQEHRRARENPRGRYGRAHAPPCPAASLVAWERYRGSQHAWRQGTRHALIAAAAGRRRRTSPAARCPPLDARRLPSSLQPSLKPCARSGCHRRMRMQGMRRRSRRSGPAPALLSCSRRRRTRVGGRHAASAAGLCSGRAAYTCCRTSAMPCCAMLCRAMPCHHSCNTALCMRSCI